MSVLIDTLEDIDIDLCHIKNEVKLIRHLSLGVTFRTSHDIASTDQALSRIVEAVDRVDEHLRALEE